MPSRVAVVTAWATSAVDSGKHTAPARPVAVPASRRYTSSSRGSARTRSATEHGHEGRDESVELLGWDDGFAGVRVRRVGVDPPMLPMPPTTFAAVAEFQLTTFVDSARPEILTSLVEWLRIPAISADPDHAGDVRASAEWCADRMRAVGLEHVRLLETAGHPSVYGDWLHAPGAPDRRSSTAITTCSRSTRSTRGCRRRSSPPIATAQLFARGAVDDKGQVLYHIEVIRALLARDGGAAGEPEAPGRGRGGGGQPELRGRCSPTHRDLLALRRRRGVRHRDVGGRRAVDVHRDARARRVRGRARAPRRTDLHSRIVRRRGPQRRARRRASSRPRCTTPTVGSRCPASTTRSGPSPTTCAPRSPRSRSPTTSSGATPRGAAPHRRGRVLARWSGSGSGRRPRSPGSRPATRVTA